MDLLALKPQDRLIGLAQQVFDKHFASDPQLEQEYDQRRKRLMMDDIRHNLEYLDRAVRFDAQGLFADYALWLFRLLASRMSDLSTERVRQQMIRHYELLMEVAEQEYPPEQGRKAKQYLSEAIAATKEAEARLGQQESAQDSPHRQLQQTFLQLLIEGKRREAAELVDQAVEEGVSLQEVYLHVFQQTMYEVGELWHQNKLTVDKEHFCTAMTQSIMAQLYPMIFSTPRRHRTMLACCVGSELHEMGIRMLCDIFELHGWDSIYLGAAVPPAGILHALAEHQPELAALSVTMPHYLDLCREVLASIRQDERFASIKIAVGGRAFQLAPHLPDQWGADISTANAVELVEWADQHC